MHRNPRLTRNSQSSMSLDDIMSLSAAPDASPSSSAEAASLIHSAAIATSPSQLVASLSASSVSSRPPLVAVGSSLPSPIFPARMVTPQSIPAPLAFPASQWANIPVNTSMPTSVASVCLPRQSSVGLFVPAAVGASVNTVASQPWPSIAHGPDPRITMIASVQQSLPHSFAATGTPYYFACQNPGAGPSASVPGVTFPGGSFSLADPRSPLFSPSNFPPVIVGPGFPPVPPKLVASILAGEFIELALLLDDQLEPDTPSFAIVADQLIFRPTKRRKDITDILTWMQAFSVFMLVLTSYSPSRAVDLIKYQLLIMRTAQKFPFQFGCHTIGRSGFTLPLRSCPIGRR